MIDFEMDLCPNGSEQLDPRIQIELENLNCATDEINFLESTLEEANGVFRSILSESSAQLEHLSKKLQRYIDKGRPYYEALEVAQRVQLDCQRAAVQYQRASALHQAAKETIAMAEERFANCHNKSLPFDSAWQEMLNHATMKIMEAEAQKAASKREHLQCAETFASAEQKVHQLGQSLKSVIQKSQPYFEQKAAFQAQLEVQKLRIYQMQRDIVTAKTKYAKSLHSLEEISEEIHEQRRCNLPRREPGVGAELPPVKMEPELSFYGEVASGNSIEKKLSEDEKYWDNLHQKLSDMQIRGESELTSSDSYCSEEQVITLEPRPRVLSGCSNPSSTSIEDIPGFISEMPLEKQVDGASLQPDLNKATFDSMPDLVPNLTDHYSKLSLSSITLECSENSDVFPEVYINTEEDEDAEHGIVVRSVGVSEPADEHPIHHDVTIDEKTEKMPVTTHEGKAEEEPTIECISVSLGSSEKDVQHKNSETSEHFDSTDKLVNSVSAASETSLELGDLHSDENLVQFSSANACALLDDSR